MLKIRGNLPTLPRGLWESPRIAAVEATDMRYISFNTVDMFQVPPTYSHARPARLETTNAGWLGRTCGDDVHTWQVGL